MRFLPIACCAAALASCAAPHASAVTKPALTTSVPEVWVDASAKPGGDGSRARPLQELRAIAAQKGPRLIHVATGMYAGPFELGPQVRIEGGEAVVLHAEGSEPQVVTLGEGSALSRLMVQGGVVGVQVPGGGELDRVQLSGQRRVAVQLDSGKLVARRLDLAGTLSGTIGISLSTHDAALEVSDSIFHGPFATALELKHGGTLALRSSRFEGPVTALSAVDSTITLDEVRISGGRGPALSFSGGTARIKNLVIVGHEYGLLIGAGAAVTLEDYTSIRADRTAMGLAKARVDARDVTILEAGTYGGIQSIASTLRLEHFLVSGAREWGVMIFEGEATLRDGTIRAIRSNPQGAMGDGLQARRSKVRAEAIGIDRVDGTGVLAAEGAEVTLRAIDVHTAKWGSVSADSGARIDARSIVSRGSPASAIVVPEDAAISVDALVSEQDAQGPIYAECSQGAVVYAGRVKADSRLGLGSSCIGVLQAAPAPR